MGCPFTMNRASIITLFFATAMACLPSPAAAREGQPNIVLILADDLGYGSLGCYGSKQIRTPHLDRLAASGMRLTDFHSSGPMCTPTRAALMTGRYPQRCAWVPDEDLSPVFREQRRENPVQRWAWGIALSEQTIAETLREAGYRTGLVGKWHLGYDSRFHPMNQGFDEFRGFISGAVIRVDGGVPTARHTWTLEPARNSFPYNGFPLYQAPKALSDDGGQAQPNAGAHSDT